MHAMQTVSSTVTHRAPGERGIVLVVAMIMLVIVSILATISVRNATSSESVSANVRMRELASQAAETALRQCEDALIAYMTGGTSPLTLNGDQILDYSVPPHWQSPSLSWDVTPTSAIILATTTVNFAGVNVTFSRPPECMIERLEPSTAATYSLNFVVTARGFGPEVAAADSARSRAKGSEVWVQSTIELQ